MSLPKLTSLSTQTLSLLLERQRLQSLSANATGPRSNTSLHFPQITRNLKQLRVGVLELERKDGKTEASELLRGQYERMRGMLGVDGEEEGIERYESTTAARSRFVTIHIRLPDQLPQMTNSNAPPFGAPSPRLQPSHPVLVPRKEHEPVYARYTDDPEAGYGDPSILLQTQQRMMDGRYYTD
jgi:syntaxin 8